MNTDNQLETVRGIQAGMTAIFASLIATHPNYRQLQLHLTAVLEVAVEGGFGSTALTDYQKQVAQEYVEQLQQIHEVRAEIDPMGSLRRPPG